MQSRLRWCFGPKGGAKLHNPSKRLTSAYIDEAKLSLKRAEKNFLDGDMLWTAVVIYYAEYYALYAFLQCIGVTCKNHDCSIQIVTHILGNTDTISEHKEKRIDAQYYMRLDKEVEVKNMLNQAKMFVLEFDKIISNIKDNEVKKFRNQLKKTIKP